MKKKKNPHAVAMGKEGGKARKKMPKSKRKAIASLGGQAFKANLEAKKLSTEGVDKA